MDTIFTRLEKASRIGDVDLFRRLLEEDEYLLERVMARTSVGDNPLHIAALKGHSDFAAEVIKTEPELAMQRNGQGLFPMHLAAANGHLPVVKELLKTGSELCREEKDGLTPLHVAVINGRTPIVRALVEACEETMELRTYGGEHVLHLAAKSNSLETLKFLTSRINNPDARDRNGNTVLHLAVGRKQLSVIELLLTNTAIDVNSLNSKGFTPLDVLLESPHEYGDLVLGEMIRAAGGKTAAEVKSPQTDSISFDGSSSKTGIEISAGPFGFPSQVKYRKKDNDTANSAHKEEKKEKKYNADILMVVATLVATITFQGALNPPGGVTNEGKAALRNSLMTFLVCDMIGLFGSIGIILHLLCGVPRKKKVVIKFLAWILWVATFSTALAFSVAVAEIYFDFDNSSEKHKVNQDYVYINVLIQAWFVVLRVAILWVAIRLIIFLLEKGKLLEPVLQLFHSLMQRGLLFRWLRLHNEEETTNQMGKTSSLRKAILILLIVSVITITAITFWGIFFIFDF